MAEDYLLKKIKESNDEQLLSEAVKEKHLDDFVTAVRKTGRAFPTHGDAGKTYEHIRLLEMMRRLKQSIIDLNTTTTFYSKILIFLTLVMLGAVLLQVYLLFK